MTAADHAKRIVNERMGRACTPGTCRHCNAPILTGPDHHRFTLTTKADPQPIDEAWEIRCLLQGRYTYDLIPAALADRKALERREGSAHRRRYYPVLAQHLCGDPTPPEHVIQPAAPADAGNPPY